MPPKKNRFGGALVNLQLAGFLPQFGHHYRDRGWPRWPARSVCGHDQTKVLDILRLQAIGQPAYSAIAHLLDMCHMVAHQRSHTFDNGDGCPESSEETFCEGNTGFLVPRRDDTAFAIFAGFDGCRNLAEIVRQNSKAEDDSSLFIRVLPAGEIYERIAAMASMDKNISLG